MSLLKLQSKAVREELAPLLWHSFGAVTILLQLSSSCSQEVISVYRFMPNNLTEKQSNRVCNALALFQGMAAHPDTKHLLMKANIPMYLYPFLDSTNKEKPHEFLRLTSLGVIGALVKVDDPVTTRFLLESQVFPCCLRSMEFADHLLSKTVATFIVHRLILNDEGLRYCCALADRFFAVSHQLAKMVEQLANSNEMMLGGDTPKRLLKHIIWCYQRLSESPRACNGLRTWLPLRLRDAAFISIIQDDVTAMQCLQRLFNNLAARNVSPPPAIDNLLTRLVRH
ncbi:unnamed protein product [Linum tenue]|uniref:Cell differentiation protein rcd1 n=1 Tax=Linum tenue TaxID=586396 RepID=A0AAV0R394_9ROSI|nr:unnamed protein product [Linum tenue]